MSTDTKRCLRRQSTTLLSDHKERGITCDGDYHSRSRRPKRPQNVIPICGLCLGTSNCNNRTNSPEDLIACWTCGQSGHPSCLKMPNDLVIRIRPLRWCCVECKRCCLCQEDQGASASGSDPGSDLLLCDSCDRGFHMSCLEPRLDTLPEGTWICPICASGTTDGSLAASTDARLQAISARSQLNQHEIDWMHQMLISSDDIIVPPASPEEAACSSSSVGSTSLKRSSSLRRQSITAAATSTTAVDAVSNLNATPSVPSVTSTTTSRSSSVKLSKRLVQKSLMTWTVAQSRNSPVKTIKTDSMVNHSPVAPRPRRTSAVASHVWQSLIRQQKRVVQKTEPPLSNANADDANAEAGDGANAEVDDDDKTDILIEEAATHSRQLFPRRSILSNRVSQRGLKSPQLKQDSPRTTLPHTHARTALNHIKKMSHRGGLRRPWKRPPSGSAPCKATLRRWFNAGVNIKRALSTFSVRGRVKLSEHRGHRQVKSLAAHSGEPTLPSSDASKSSSEDGSESIVTLAADDLEESSETKVTDSVDQFDANKEEWPELAVITDEDRAMFAEIQAEVQACLPQPMESSLALPPANNPKLLLLESKDSDLPDADRGASSQTPVIEPRYPPRIQLGRHIITTWYSSPYPSEYARLNLLYICEFCLKYAKTREVYMRHIEKCPFSFPPGNEVYRCGEVSVFEVDGYSSRLYCQQLCLLAKLFLDHKTLYYDVDPFLFYVAVLRENSCFQLVGYYSKEKRSAQKFNLSCIMVLPPYQKSAFGRFLIDFSFLLSRIEGQPGSPEKPLSELGRLSYESYWRSKVLPFILVSLHAKAAATAALATTGPTASSNHIDDAVDMHECICTIHQITSTTGIDPHDVAATIEQMAVSIQLGADGRPLIVFDKERLLELEAKYNMRSKNWIIVDEECLRWSPLVHPQEMDNHSEILSDEDDQEVDAVPLSGTSPVPNIPNTPERSDTPQLPPTTGARNRRAHGTDFTTSNHSPSGPTTSSLDYANPSIGNPEPHLTLHSRSSAFNVGNGKPTAPTSTSTPSAQITQSIVDGESDSLLCTPTDESTPFSQSNATTDSDDAQPKVNHRRRRMLGKSGGRNRRSLKRSHRSPCRKKPFFPNGPKPPDPPSPNGGPANSGAVGSHASGPRLSRTCRSRLSRSGGSVVNSGGNPTELMERDDGHERGTNAAEGLPPLLSIQTSNVRVNSSLPDDNSITLPQPSHCSSPRALIERLLDVRMRLDADTPVSSPPPALSPPPPTLSLVDGELVNPSQQAYMVDITSPKPITAPPCLSLYDSASHLPATDNSMTKPIGSFAGYDRLMANISTHEEYPTLVTLNPSGHLKLSPPVRQSARGHGSTQSLHINHTTATITSCPASPVKRIDFSLLGMMQRSASASQLYDSPHATHQSLMYGHSSPSSASPPILHPPLEGGMDGMLITPLGVDGRQEQFGRSATLQVRQCGGGSCSSGSPSPPLLTNAIVDKTDQDEERCPTMTKEEYLPFLLANCRTSLADENDEDNNDADSSITIPMCINEDSTASNPSGPRSQSTSISRHSSQETVAMQLPPASLSSRSSSSSLNNEEARFSLYCTASSSINRSRHASEPQSSTICLNESTLRIPPPEGSLRSTRSMLDLTNVSESLTTSPAAFSPSEHYSQLDLLDLINSGDDKQTSTDAASQPTTNATPESFTYGMTSDGHSEEMKLCMERELQLDPVEEEYLTTTTTHVPLSLFDEISIEQAGVSLTAAPDYFAPVKSQLLVLVHEDQVVSVNHHHRVTALPSVSLVRSPCHTTDPTLLSVSKSMVYHCPPVDVLPSLPSPPPRVVFTSLPPKSMHDPVQFIDPSISMHPKQAIFTLANSIAVSQSINSVCHFGNLLPMDTNYMSTGVQFDSLQSEFPAASTIATPCINRVPAEGAIFSANMNPSIPQSFDPRHFGSQSPMVLLPSPPLDPSTLFPSPLSPQTRPVLSQSAFLPPASCPVSNYSSMSWSPTTSPCAQWPNAPVSATIQSRPASTTGKRVRHNSYQMMQQQQQQVGAPPSPRKLMTTPRSTTRRRKSAAIPERGYQLVDLQQQPTSVCCPLPVQQCGSVLPSHINQNPQMPIFPSSSIAPLDYPVSEGGIIVPVGAPFPGGMTNIHPFQTLFDPSCHANNPFPLSGNPCIPPQSPTGPIVTNSQPIGFNQPPLSAVVPTGYHQSTNVPTPQFPGHNPMQPGSFSSDQYHNSLTTSCDNISVCMMRDMTDGSLPPASYPDYSASGLLSDGNSMHGNIYTATTLPVAPPSNQLITTQQQQQHCKPYQTSNIGLLDNDFIHTTATSLPLMGFTYPPCSSTLRVPPVQSPFVVCPSLLLYPPYEVNSSECLLTNTKEGFNQPASMSADYPPYNYPLTGQPTGQLMATDTWPQMYSIRGQPQSTPAHTMMPS